LDPQPSYNLGIEVLNHFLLLPVEPTGMHVKQHCYWFGFHPRLLENNQFSIQLKFADFSKC
jgi:hypothetical protein